MNAAAPGKFPWRRLPRIGHDPDGPACVVYDSLPASFESSSIFEHFTAAAKRTPDVTAIIHDSGSLTYSEIHVLVLDLAERITRSVPEDQAVAILLPNTPDALIAALACMASVRTCLVLNSGHPPARNAAILRSAGVRAVVLIGGAGADKTMLPPDAITIEVKSGLEHLPGHLAQDSHPRAALHCNDRNEDTRTATVLYTSGSTGQPKGIVITQYNLLARMQAYIDPIRINRGDRLLSLGPFCTSGGLTISLVGLLTGASQLLVSSSAHTPARLLALIREHKVTLLFGMPTLLRELAGCEGSRDALRSVRLVRTAAEPVLNSDLKLLRSAFAPDCQLLVTYGQTEALISQWFVPPDYGRGSGELPKGAVLSGRILDHHEFAIVDENGAPVRDGEPGELILRGRNFALGEWQMACCTPGQTSTDPDDPSLRVLATGDLVRLLPGEMLQVLGRRDRLVKIHGNRVEPVEIEELLRRAPEVADAAVAVRRDGPAPRLIAAVVPVSETLRAADLRGALRTRVRAGLPSWMQPARIIVVPRLPRLPDGKVDEAALLAAERLIPHDEAVDAIDATGAPPPSLRSRAIVARAWRETLNRKSLERDAAFDEAGGDSLQLLTLVMRLDELSNETLPLEAFHTSMRPTDVARLLDRLAAERVAEQEPGNRPVLFIAPGLGGYEPRLAALIAGCAATVRIVPLVYPAWTDLWSAPPPTLAAFAQGLLAQIDTEVPSGLVMLGGYSFGGQVAHAVADALLQRGRSVQLLASLDAVPPGRSQAAALSGNAMHWLQRLSRLVRRGPFAIMRSVAFRVRFQLMRTVVAKCLIATKRYRSKWPNFALRFEYELSQLQFAMMSQHWRAQCAAPAPLEVPVVVFRSEEHDALEAPDLGWNAISRSVTVVPVRGTHFTMFDGPNLSVLCAALSNAVTQSLLSSQVPGRQVAAPRATACG